MVQDGCILSDIGSSLNFLKWLNENTAFFKSVSTGKLSFVEDFSYSATARNNKGEILNLLNVIIMPGINQQEKWENSVLSGIKAAVENSDNKIKADTSLLALLENMEKNTSSENIKNEIRV